ncbi:MAG: hypothetical protein ACRDNS_29675, partial [Trebonia sp.]
MHAEAAAPAGALVAELESLLELLHAESASAATASAATGHADRVNRRRAPPGLLLDRRYDNSPPGLIEGPRRRRSFRLRIPRFYWQGRVAAVTALPPPGDFGHAVIDVTGRGDPVTRARRRPRVAAFAVAKADGPRVVPT